MLLDIIGKSGLSRSTVTLETISNLSQRWIERRPRYRFPEETIRTSDYEIVEIAGDKEAKDFVCRHHYRASYPAARWRFGLYHHGVLVGVAVFSHPCNDRVLSVFPGEPIESVELGRLVLLDDVPYNAESWFVGNCFRRLRREGVIGVVSFSDLYPRSDVDGNIVMPGHLGSIYWALNGRYLGRSAARTLTLLPDGTVLHPRSISKIRSGSRGWIYSSEILSNFGAPAPDFDRRIVWLETWLTRLTRSIRHGGNHKYLWCLQKSAIKSLPQSLPYPKWGTLPI